MNRRNVIHIRRKEAIMKSIFWGILGAVCWVIVALDDGCHCLWRWTTDMTDEQRKDMQAW
jgi:hypothetical protein